MNRGSKEELELKPHPFNMYNLGIEVATTLIGFNFNLPLGNQLDRSPIIDLLSDDITPELRSGVSLDCQITIQRIIYQDKENFVVKLEVSFNDQITPQHFKFTLGDSSDYQEIVQTFSEIKNHQSQVSTFYELHQLLFEVAILSTENSDFSEKIFFPAVKVDYPERKKKLENLGLLPYANVYLVFDWEGFDPEIQIIVTFPDREKPRILNYRCKKVATFQFAKSTFMKFVFKTMHIQNLTMTDIVEGIELFADQVYLPSDLFFFQESLLQIKH